jgi:hypothetical protein
MATKEPRDPDQRYPYTFRCKGKALDWMDRVAARHGIDSGTLARELFAMGSQMWQKAHPDDIDPAATRA